MLQPGDSVVAVLPQHGDADGLPVQRPVVGEVYTVTRVYAMSYGWGVQLEGLDHYPYQGYFYLVEPGNPLSLPPGVYFRKLEPWQLKYKVRVMENT